MLRVYYTQAPDGLAATVAWSRAYRALLARVPAGRRERLERFRNEQARTASAMALMLLEYAMRRSAAPDFALNELVDATDDYKPHCPGRPDFNISHSHAAVYCALIEPGRIGVDVERVRPLNFDGFERMISAGELAAAGGDAPFFDVWTRKEATLKAQGQSGVWDMHRVTLDRETQTAGFKNEQWRIQSLPAPEGYRASLAWRDNDEQCRCEPVDAQTLITA